MNFDMLVSKCESNNQSQLHFHHKKIFVFSFAGCNFESKLTDAVIDG